ncbi:MAG: glycosyltransferase [Bythopirellula sp.]|nr:glycosyltransferase [Bythopirellula sp.]
MHFHFGKDGGAERFFVHLVNAFARVGIEQKVVIRRHRIWRSEIERAADVTERNYRDASLDRLLLPWWVTRTARTWQPDAFFAWMPRACRVLPRKSNCIRIARLGDYPLKLTHFRDVDVLVCNTPGIAAHVKQLGWQRGIECISNFTNTHQVPPIDRATLDTPRDAPLILSMGRFVPRKGFDVLLRALAKTPGAYLWLLGEGEQRDNLHSLARDLGVLNRVRFVGWIADPRPYVAASNVFAMASSHEPLGNVILEAWAQRVPVVSTRSEGPQWFMRDSQNGLLVDIGDSEGFATSFRRILADSALAQQLVTGGSATLEDTFSERAVVNAYLKLFSSHNAHRQAA